MNRRNKLRKLFEPADGYKDVVEPMIDDVIFIESRLTELRELPFINVNPTDPTEQKATAAAKQYKELLQQYNNCIKILCGILKGTTSEDESPLREFIKSKK